MSQTTHFVTEFRLTKVLRNGSSFRNGSLQKGSLDSTKMARFQGLHTINRLELAYRIRIYKMTLKDLIFDIIDEILRKCQFFGATFDTLDAI